MKKKHLAISVVILGILFLFLISGCAGAGKNILPSPDSGETTGLPPSDPYQPPAQAKAGDVSIKLKAGWNTITYNLATPKKISSASLTCNNETKLLKDAVPGWTQGTIRWLKGRAWVLLPTNSTTASFQPGGKYYIYCAINGAILNFNKTFIQAITPPSAKRGISVTLAGANFGNTQGESTVTFNESTAATVTSWSDTQIVCTVPYGLPMTSVPVTVTVAGTTSSPFDFTVLVPIGEMKWQAAWSQWDGGPAIGADGAIYCSRGSGSTVTAFNPDGTVKWTNTNGGPGISKSMAISPEPAGLIFGSARDGITKALNPSDGSVAWSKTSPVFSPTNYGSPAVAADGSVYTVTRGSSNSSLDAYLPDGTLKWNLLLGQSGLNSSPSVSADGTIYVGGNGCVWAVKDNGSSYSLLWTATVSNCDASDCTPAIGADGTIYLTSRQNSNKLYAVNPATRTVKWSVSLGPSTSYPIRTSSAIIAGNGTIYVGSYDNRLTAVNPAGSVTWNFPTGGLVASTPCLTTDGTIYFGCSDGKVYAVKDGGTEALLQWTFTMDAGTRTSPAIGTDGTVYICSDNSIYAIYGSAPLDTSAPWPAFRHDSKRTGRYGGN
jgi:outer membrane protein assembly factor BamB